MAAKTVAHLSVIEALPSLKVAATENLSATTVSLFHRLDIGMRLLVRAPTAPVGVSFGESIDWS